MKRFLSFLEKMLARKEKSDLQSELEFLGYEAYSRSNTIAMDNPLAKASGKS